MKTNTQETKQHIIEVGYQLMVSKGFSSVGLSEILKSAGVPKGSFYHYFKSKEQFGEVVIQNYFDSYFKHLNNLISTNNGTGYEDLMLYWKRWWETQSPENDENKCLVVKLSAEVSDLSEAMRTALKKGTLAVISWLSGGIERGIRDGSIPEVDCIEIAEVLYSMWLGASLLSKLNHNDKALAQAFKQTKKILKKDV